MTHSNSFKALICYFWFNPLVLTLIMSASLLGGAYAFQYIGGMEPCALCWPQRYAHMAILALSIVGLLAKNASRELKLAFVGATVIALDVSFAIAGYHAGVEQKWWKGPETCTSSGMTDSTDMESLFDNMMETNIVLCDEIPWDMFGISMAGYNFLISFVTALFVTFALLSQLRNKHA